MKGLTVLYRVYCWQADSDLYTEVYNYQWIFKKASLVPALSATTLIQALNNSENNSTDCNDVLKHFLTSRQRF